MCLKDVRKIKTKITVDDLKKQENNKHLSWHNVSNEQVILEPVSNEEKYKSKNNNKLKIKFTTLKNKPIKNSHHICERKRIDITNCRTCNSNIYFFRTCKNYI